MRTGLAVELVTAFIIGPAGACKTIKCLRLVENKTSTKRIKLIEINFMGPQVGPLANAKNISKFLPPAPATTMKYKQANNDSEQ